MNYSVTIEFPSGRETYVPSKDEFWRRVREAGTPIEFEFRDQSTALASEDEASA